MELALDARSPQAIRRSRVVSILVFVELALDGHVFSKLVWNALFQSLFSWNLLLMAAAHPVYDRHNDEGVSILVFVELALDVYALLYREYIILAVSILVFVELALDARTAPSAARAWWSTLWGFNPCFRGTCS